jgi:hypothetical protein
MGSRAAVVQRSGRCLRHVVRGAGGRPRRQPRQPAPGRRRRAVQPARPVPGAVLSGWLRHGRPVRPLDVREPDPGRHRGYGPADVAARQRADRGALAAAGQAGGRAGRLSTLEAAIGEHQANVDTHKLLDLAPFSDDRLPGLDWQATTPTVSRRAIEATDVAMLIRAGWLDGGFAAGAVRRFASFANEQEVEIGPWGHCGRTYADTLRPDGALAGSCSGPGARTAGWWSSSPGTSSGPNAGWQAQLDLRHGPVADKSAHGLQHERGS